MLECICKVKLIDKFYKGGGIMKLYVKPELEVVEMYSAEAIAALPSGFEGWANCITSYLFGASAS